MSDEKQQREQRAFEKAAKIPASEWTGPVFREGFPGGDGEGYYESIDELLDFCENGAGDDDPCAPPAFVWATSTKRPDDTSAGKLAMGRCQGR